MFDMRYLINFLLMRYCLQRPTLKADLVEKNMGKKSLLSNALASVQVVRHVDTRSLLVLQNPDLMVPQLCYF